MRRLLLATAIATLAFGAAACDSSTPSADATAATAAPTPSPTAVDLKAATTAACKEAVAASDAGPPAFDKGLEDVLNAVVAEDDAKGEAGEAAMRAALKAWSDKLTALAAQPIDAGLKATLTESASVIVKLTSPDDQTPVNTVKKNLAEIAQKIKTSCA
jgi:hypothetical protein